MANIGQPPLVLTRKSANILLMIKSFHLRKGDSEGIPWEVYITKSVLYGSTPCHLNPTSCPWFVALFYYFEWTLLPQVEKVGYGTWLEQNRITLFLNYPAKK